MARNRNRQAGPIRRTLVAPHVETAVSRNPLLRVQTVTAPSMPVRRTTAVSLSGAQPNDWGRTPYLRPFETASTAAWDYTVSSHR